MSSKYGHWKKIRVRNLDKYEGFIYLITNTVNGMKYVGRKGFWRYSKRKRIGESNWRTYTGSSKTLNEDLKKIGIENFTFEVLYLSESKSDLNLSEIEYQVWHNACRDPMYYNHNLGNTRVGFRCKTIRDKK